MVKHRKIRVKKHSRRLKTGQRTIVNKHIRRLKASKKVLPKEIKRECYNCGDNLHWYEILRRNPCIPEKEMEKLWLSPDIEFYCCKCFDEKEEEIKRINLDIFKDSDIIDTFYRQTGIELDKEKVLFNYAEGQIEIENFGDFILYSNKEYAKNAAYEIFKDNLFQGGQGIDYLLRRIPEKELKTYILLPVVYELLRYHADYPSAKKDFILNTRLYYHDSYEDFISDYKQDPVKVIKQYGNSSTIKYIMSAGRFGNTEENEEAFDRFMEKYYPKILSDEDSPFGEISLKIGMVAFNNYLKPGAIV